MYCPLFLTSSMIKFLHKKRGITCRLSLEKLSQNFMYLLLDVPYPSVYRRFGHPKLHGDLYPGMVLYPEIEYIQLVTGEVAHTAEPFTLRLSELISYIHACWTSSTAF